MAFKPGDIVQVKSSKGHYYRIEKQLGFWTTPNLRYNDVQVLYPDNRAYLATYLSTNRFSEVRTQDGVVFDYEIEAIPAEWTKELSDPSKEYKVENGQVLSRKKVV